MLLSTASGDPMAPYYSGNVALAPAVVSAPQNWSSQFPAGASNATNFSPIPSVLKGAGVVLVHVRLPSTVSDAPMVLVLGPHGSGGSRQMNLADADQSSVSGAGDDAASMPQGGQGVPLSTVADENSPGEGGGMSATATFTSAPVSPVIARPGTFGWVTFDSAEPGQPTSGYSPAGGQNWAISPDGRRLEVTGTLDPDQTTMTFQVPVGQLSSLGLSLQETGGTGGVMPVFGQAELINPNGTSIEQINPPPGFGPNMLQAMTVQLRNAAANSSLKIQIMAAEPSSSGSGTTSASESGTTVTTPSAGTNFNVSFVLEIQRQELTSPVQDASASAPGALSVGTLVVAPLPQTGLSVSSAGSTTSDSPAPAAAVEEPVPSTTVSAGATETAEQSADSFDGFNVRVLTGPLASRTASPLGPTLASIDAEATQEVDRHERAMSQEIDGLGSLGDQTSLAWRSEHSDADSSGGDGNEPGSPGSPASNDGPVIDAPGNGGYPMKVTSQGRGQRTAMSALWATLPSFGESASPADNPDQPVVPIGDLALESSARDRSSLDLALAPNYVKAACGMMFGLMMTSGPLFPDLIVRLPRRIPRWIIGLRSQAGRGESPGSRRLKPRKIVSWLRGRLIAR